MAYRSATRPKTAPQGYVPGIGRGAAGFTTRSDIGPMMPSTLGVDPNSTGASTGGSRAAELRMAKLEMRKIQAGAPSPFGVAPEGYVAGAGRGAGLKSLKEEDGSGGPTGYDEFSGYDSRLFNNDPYDDEDEEADKIWSAIDERMSSRAKRKRDGVVGAFGGGGASAERGRIAEQFRELKEKLKDVTEEQWEAIPDVGDYSLKHKQKRREDVFTPLPDNILQAKSATNADATSGASVPSTASLPPVGNHSVISNISGLAEARGTVLGMSLDKMSADSATGQSVVDPKGYLTSLSNIRIATDAEVSDVNKARLLLKSVRDTNPKHGPGWIAAARVEEAADRVLQARKLIQEACETCPLNEDVWLEAARLHPDSKAKSILATAVSHLPHSVKIFLRASDLESSQGAKKAVLRRALESIPTSITLWKSAIELEGEEDARVLLSVAVEKVPHSVDMWLALAKLETYENARKVLNRARKHLPAEKSIWITAAKLEETQNHLPTVDAIIQKAIKSLSKSQASISREEWLKEAEIAELTNNSPHTSAAIIKHTVGMGVDPEDRLRTWSGDANQALARNAVATARTILAGALIKFSTKKSLWMQAVELEKRSGTQESLDEVLKAASERLPRVEIFWLMRAKERWVRGDVDTARQVLMESFKANPDSEPVWLAAAKLEWETGEVERARVLLTRARERAPSGRVYMRSAILEREITNHDRALELIREGIHKYPTFAKLYMMGGQISSRDTTKIEACKFYQTGIANCPQNTVLWTLASRLEERTNHNVTKARSLLELARLKNPLNPPLWLEAIRLERRSHNDRLAITLMAKALQECPNDGRLLAENISTSPRVEQKSKSAIAIKRCPDDPNVISAVSNLFANERKLIKARKWYERAVTLDSDLGDSWARYLAFEMEVGTPEQQRGVRARCVKVAPKHGELWCAVAKDMKNRRKSVEENLDMVAEKILEGRRNNA